nr:helix-turn-helix domain-containing protein [uncultured Rhodoferax sp.]
MTSSALAEQKAAVTRSAVHAPSHALASCVRAYVTRSTLGVPLQTDERRNFYPASLACAISWTIQGQTELVRVGDQVFKALAPSPVMFTGPHLLPSETRNPGPVEFFLLLLMPDAFHALTGVDLLVHTNQHCALSEVLGTDWQAMADRVMVAAHDAERIRLIEEFLLPRWNAARPRTWAPFSSGLLDWAHSLEMRYVTSSTGRSLRQVERRIKQWTGQTRRQLRRLARGEKTFLRARESKQRHTLMWSALADESGFSDQSHLCREFRKLTGLRPEQVMQHMDTDERLWIFKTWA